MKNCALLQTTAKFDLLFDQKHCRFAPIGLPYCTVVILSYICHFIFTPISTQIDTEKKLRKKLLMTLQQSKMISNRDFLKHRILAKITLTKPQNENKWGCKRNFENTGIKFSLQVKQACFCKVSAFSFNRGNQNHVFKNKNQKRAHNFHSNALLYNSYYFVEFNQSSAGLSRQRQIYSTFT